MTTKRTQQVIANGFDYSKSVNIDHGQMKVKSIVQTGIDSGLKERLLVGPPGFEPESIEPKSTSLDQASRRPHVVWWKQYFLSIHKNLVKPKPKQTRAASGMMTSCWRAAFPPQHSILFNFKLKPFFAHLIFFIAKKLQPPLHNA